MLRDILPEDTIEVFWGLIFCCCWGWGGGLVGVLLGLFVWCFSVVVGFFCLGFFG